MRPLLRSTNLPYIPNTKIDQKKMLESIGAASIEELMHQIPPEIHFEGKLNIPDQMSEIELNRHAHNLAKTNMNLDDNICFLGAGIYDHFIPSTVAEIISRSEFYTAYTPYQPEISQGTLQSIFEFQTLICELNGMDVTNASVYDGASALAEAAMMASHTTNRKTWVVSDCVHPAYRQTLKTYAWASGYNIVEFKHNDLISDINSLRESISEDTACVIVQNPNFFGSLEDMKTIEEITHNSKAMFVVSYDPISLGILKTPADYNADIAVAEGQPLGLSPAFGGPLLGLFSCKQQYIRLMPGRVVGKTVDGKGIEGYVLTLQTREQHIRREKATSNICSNQGLCALAATVYLSTLGKTGLKQVAEHCFHKSHYAAESINKLDGFEIISGERFFKEFIVKCPKPIKQINQALIAEGIIGGLDLSVFYPEKKNQMLISVTEKRSKEEIDKLVQVLGR